MYSRILVVEDDPDIIDILQTNLLQHGFSVEVATNGREGLEKARNEAFDVAILDIMLPELDGLELCRALREQSKVMAILLLTGRSSEIDRIVGLEIGADDYITKPFSVRELIARIKALLRRGEALRTSAEASPAESLRFGPLEIIPEQRRVLLNANEIELTAIEFDLLLFLASHPGVPFTREQLVRHVWQYQAAEHDATVSSQLSRLRKKIEPDPKNPTFIKTSWGIGYQFARAEEFE